MTKTFAQELKKKSEDYWNESNSSLEEKIEKNKNVLDGIKKELTRLAETGENKTVLHFSKKSGKSSWNLGCCGKGFDVFHLQYVVDCLKEMGLQVSSETKNYRDNLTMNHYKLIDLTISWE